jgi:DNA-binding SARP family transcriptional activator
MLPLVKLWMQQFRTFVCHSFEKPLVSLTRKMRKHGEKSPSPGASVGRLMEMPAQAKVHTKSRRATRMPHLCGSSEILGRTYCFGRLKVFLNGRPVNHWRCRREKEVFAYLTVNHTRRIHREILMNLFWPDSTPDSARNSLNVAMHGIRSRLRELDAAHDHILYDEQCYFVNPEIKIWLDIEEFLHCWRLAQRAELDHQIPIALTNYELAAALYQGDFMEDEPYGSWTTQQRENLKEIYLVILDRLGEYYVRDGHLDTAIELCRKILEKDVCREDVYRRLMRCYCQLGQRDQALRTYQKCREALKNELEAEPTRATIQLYEEVKQDGLKKTKLSEFK